MKNKLKGMKGITLIALVITIIVLLILAGVSVATLTGENGLLTQAQVAKGKQGLEGLKEEINLTMQSREIDKRTGVELNSLQDDLLTIDNVIVDKIKDDTCYVTRGEYEVTVYENGDIVQGKVDIWDGESKEVPEVVEKNWNIYNTAQLKFLADFVNGDLTEEEKAGLEITSETKVNLMADLDLGARHEKGKLLSGTPWTPIGKGTTSSIKFTGIFEGNGHTIRGMYVYVKGNYAGLFGVSTTINGVTVQDGYVKATGAGVGAIVGYLGGTSGINNCHNVNTEVIADLNTVGGIVGQFSGSEGVNNCTNSGNITCIKGSSGGHAQIGGVVGYANKSSAKIFDCKNTGNVTSKAGVYTGGVVGFVKDLAQIEKCENHGKVTATGDFSGGIVGYIGESGKLINNNNYGNITGIARTGGIAGALYDSCEVTKSNNYGVITGNGARTGGIVGWSNPSGIISECHNEGKITGNGDMKAGIAGAISNYTTVTSCSNSGTIIGKSNNIAGIVGNTNPEVTISNCSNEGEVTSTGRQTGGILGAIGNKSTISGCYNTGLINGGYATGGILGITGTEANISECYNIGDVSGEGVGGITGAVNGTITKCYNTGNITALNKEINYAGGIVATYVNNGVMNISLCYNSGTITAGLRSGGIVANLGAAGKASTLTKCYNKGSIVNSGSGVVGAIASGVQMDANVTSSYYLSTIGISQGVGSVEEGGNLEKQNQGAQSTDDDVKTYEEFLTWIESK